MTTPDFKPSEIFLNRWLVNTFKKAEGEQAALILIRYCVQHDDSWQAMPGEAIAATLLHDVNEKVEPICSFVTNPFFNPQAWWLVEEGFAHYPSDDHIEFTEKGYEALRKWVLKK